MKLYLSDKMCLNQQRPNQDENMPLGIKIAKRGLELAVAAASGYIVVKHGPEAAQYLDTLMHSPEPLKNVVDFSRGELAVGAGYLSGLTAAIAGIEYAARKIFGKPKNHETE